MLIQWRKVFETGIPRIDEQHRRLIGIINQVADIKTRGGGRKDLVAALKDCVDYTRYHFLDEEKLQQEIGYDACAEHQVMHRNLVREIVDMLTRLKDGEVVSSEELLAFLKDWFTGHILKEDKKLASRFEAWKENRAKQEAART